MKGFKAHIQMPLLHYGTIRFFATKQMFLHLFVHKQLSYKLTSSRRTRNSIMQLYSRANVKVILTWRSHILTLYICMSSDPVIRLKF